MMVVLEKIPQFKFICRLYYKFGQENNWGSVVHPVQNDRLIELPVDYKLICLLSSFYVSIRPNLKPGAVLRPC